MRIWKCERPWCCDHVCRRRKLSGAGRTLMSSTHTMTQRHRVDRTTSSAHDAAARALFHANASEGRRRLFFFIDPNWGQSDALPSAALGCCSGTGMLGPCRDDKGSPACSFPLLVLFGRFPDKGVFANGQPQRVTPLRMRANAWDAWPRGHV